MRTNYLFVLLLLGVAIYIVHAPHELIEPDIPKLRTFPTHVGQWVAVQDTIFNAPTLKVLRPTDYLMRTYINPEGNQLSLYIGYHSGGASSGPIHSPKNCLPSAGWYLENSKGMQLQMNDEGVNLVRADYKKDGRDVTYYYWYQIRGKTITQDIAMKLTEFTGMFLKQRKDASFIRIGVLNSGAIHGDSLVYEFLQNAFPLLKKHLPS